MFDIIVLICAMGMEPQECQPPTAVDRMFLGSVPNEIRCGIDGEEHPRSGCEPREARLLR
jgi:hypothetical protein